MEWFLKFAKALILLVLIVALNIATTVGVLHAAAGATSFDGYVILNDSIGSAASPAAAGFGFGRAAHGVVPVGPSIRTGTGSPNGTTTGVKGSEWIRSDSSGQHYYNTDGGTTWVLVTTS